MVASALLGECVVAEQLNYIAWAGAYEAGRQPKYEEIEQQVKQANALSAGNI